MNFILAQYTYLYFITILVFSQQIVSLNNEKICSNF